MNKLTTSGWRYARNGPLNTVLKWESFDVIPASGHAVVQMVLATLHRSDSAVINGSASTGRWDRLKNSSFPRVGGCEGVGRVVRTGSESAVKEGDLVWVAPCHGTWAREVSVDSQYVHKINPQYAQLASTASNFLLAEHLLRSFRTLKSGDVVIQNGGSSITSLAVSALAKGIGVKVHTASCVGDRYAEAVRRHEKYGSDVFEYSSEGVRKMLQRMGGHNASLFLSGVGGDQFDNFLKLMKPQGDVVCYGAQNGAGLFISGSNLFFPEVTVHGTLFPKYFASLNYEERQRRLDNVLTTLSSLDFTYPVVTGGSLESLPDVWNETFLKGGSKGIITVAN